MKVTFLLSLLVATTFGAETCIQGDNCIAPDCICATTSSPLADQFPVPLLPQFVVVSMNDAITVSNFPFYNEIVNTYKNPNGCPMTMTMFLTHPNNDYTYANEMWRLGNELGVRSVTTPSVTYWKNANYTVWKNEISDARSIITKYGRIPEEDIKGTRAPYMQIGGDDMYQAVKEAGFLYDSSWTALDYTNWYGAEPLGALFPYTLDFQSPQIPDDCPFGRCPANPYPGLFTTPVLDLESVSGQPCNMIDACQSLHNETECPEKVCEDRVYQFLKDNFDYNYNSNRAPIGLHTAPSWFNSVAFNSTAHSNGYKRFLEYAQSLQDVWIISHEKLLAYMKNPVISPDVGTLEDFQCPVYPPETNCPSPTSCNYEDAPVFGRMTMRICSKPCPDHYPWLGNVDGN